MATEIETEIDIISIKRDSFKSCSSKNNWFWVVVFGVLWKVRCLIERLIIEIILSKWPGFPIRIELNDSTVYELSVIANISIVLSSPLYYIVLASWVSFYITYQTINQRWVWCLIIHWIWSWICIPWILSLNSIRILPLFLFEGILFHLVSFLLKLTELFFNLFLFFCLLFFSSIQILLSFFH